MKIFSFDPGQYRDAYREDHFVHIKDGVDPEFQQYLREAAARRPVKGVAPGVQVEECVFDFPEGADYPGELFDVVAAVTGLNRPTLTLSERHIKAYEPDAFPEVPAHKDRLASKVAMGLAIDIPPGSRLVLYPFGQREVNPYTLSADLRSSLEPEQLPETALRTAPEVELADAPGDVVLFAGSSMWHSRRNAARSLILYLKFNDFDCDPLGEDPHTPARRARTLELLEKGDASALAASVPAAGRRLDYISRRYTRDGAGEVLQTKVWGASPCGLSEGQFQLFRAIDGRRTWRELVARQGGEGVSEAEVQAGLKRLARAGVIDLLESPPPR